MNIILNSHSLKALFLKTTFMNDKIELQSLLNFSFANFTLKKKAKHKFFHLKMFIAQYRTIKSSHIKETVF